MASFEVKGIEAAEAAMLKQSARAARAVPKMLNAGAEVLIEHHKREIAATFRGARSTGDMQKGVKKTNIKSSGHGKSLYVYPQGNDRHGVSNATKYFVQNYGRSNMRASYVRDKANKAAADDVQAAMKREWEETQ